MAAAEEAPPTRPRRRAAAAHAAGAGRDERDTRERILAAALEAFAANGFDGATTRDIAARAGVNLGLIKYYFDSKLKLWRAAVDRAFGNLRERIDADSLDDILDARERTELIIRRFVHFVAEQPEFARLMQEEGKRSGPRMRWIVDRHAKPIYESTTKLLAEAQVRGLLPEGIDPAHYHYILIGAMTLIFHQSEECRRLTGIDPRGPAAAEAHADAVVHLVLGPRTEDPS